MKKIGLKKWFNLKTQDVLNEFGALKNAKMVGISERQYVYIPGERDDRVLLVAHSDTFFRDEKLDIGYDQSKGVFFSKKSGVGIGADDRAGCSIVWNLQNSGHSIIIPNAEEQGCIGSHFAISDKEFMKELNSHRFAIEFDRCHARDLVFYNVGSREFVKWCEENFFGYKESIGSCTDIKVLCNPMCGVNISIGYYNQHTDKETLVESEWHRTLNLAKRVLFGKNLPEFRYERKTYGYDVHSSTYAYRLRNSDNTDKGDYNNYNEYYKQKYGIKDEDTNSLSYISYCTNCVAIMCKSEIENNGKNCIYCQHKIYD